MEEKKLIYIVKCSSGEYEDYREWNIKAFFKKEDAEKFAKETDEANNKVKTPCLPENLWNDANDYMYDLAEKDDVYGNPYKHNTEEWQKRFNEIEEFERKTVLEYLNEHGDREYTIDDYNHMETWEHMHYSMVYECAIEELEIE